MLYKDNGDIQKALRVLAVTEGTTLAGIGELNGLSQQNFWNKTHKKNITFAEIAEIIAPLGYRLSFEFIKDTAQNPTEDR